MSEQRRQIVVQARVSYALWPGDGFFCVRTEFSTGGGVTFTLIDREDRFHELAPYRHGMFGGRR